MSIRLLEKNNVQISNFDGMVEQAIASNFRSGIVKGMLNECAMASTTNTVSVGTGYIYINGARVVFDSLYTVTFADLPAADTAYHLVLKLVYSSGNFSDPEIISREVATLTQDDILGDGQGTYEYELCTFTAGPNGISNIVKQAENLSTIYDIFEDISETLTAFNEALNGIIEG